jgi:medium-chain acyl-[acyl-carrier-protein] hydrolase
VTVCPIRRPGRESAHAEPLLRDVPAIVAGSLRALATVPDLPCVLFGHSLGALVAFELARELQSAGKTPRLLVVAAKPAPQSPTSDPPLAELPDARFLREVDARYGGIPRELKDVPELLAMLLPVIRADITASEGYRHAPGPRLRCPIVVYHGRDDRTVDPANLASWAELTEAGCETHVLPGDHFFPHDPASGFSALLRARLAALV